MTATLSTRRRDTIAADLTNAAMGMSLIVTGNQLDDAVERALAVDVDRLAPDDANIVLRGILATVAMAVGDTCPSCSRPGIDHKGVIQCDTRTCNRYGDTLRVL